MVFHLKPANHQQQPSPNLFPICHIAFQARDPRAAGEADPTTTHGMSTTMEHLDQAEHGHHARHMMFRAGRVVERGTDQARDVRSDADGVCWKERTSVDAMLFPMLHPGGMGAFRRGESLSDMLQQRMQQMFSGFTLLPEYVLVMYQVSCQVLGHTHANLALPCVQHAVCLAWWKRAAQVCISSSLSPNYGSGHILTHGAYMCHILVHTSSMSAIGSSNLFAIQRRCRTCMCTQACFMRARLTSWCYLPVCAG